MQFWDLNIPKMALADCSGVGDAVCQASRLLEDQLLMGTATERPYDLPTEARFLPPCYHRVRFPDSTAFVAGSLQTFVGDFRPEHFQSPGCRLVRVRFSVIRYPRHRDQAPVAQNSMVLRREDVIFHAIKRRAFDPDQKGFFTPLLATSTRWRIPNRVRDTSRIDHGAMTTMSPTAR